MIKTKRFYYYISFNPDNQPKTIDAQINTFIEQNGGEDFKFIDIKYAALSDISSNDFEYALLIYEE